jgi:hypothetical protein
MKKIVILSNRTDIDDEFVRLLNRLFEDCEICIMSTAREITRYEPGPRLLPNTGSSQRKHFSP